MKIDAPQHLSPAAKALWTRLYSEFKLDDSAGQLLLLTLCEARDRCEQARQQIKAEGLMIQDRFGQAKINPLVNVERDARSAVLACVRALHLAPSDVE